MFFSLQNAHFVKQNIMLKTFAHKTAFVIYFFFIFVLRFEQKTANVDAAVWGSEWTNEWMYSQQGSLRLALVFCVVVTFVSGVRLPFPPCRGMRQTHLHVVTASEKYSELNDSKWKRQTIIDCKCIIRVGEMGQSKAKCFVSWWDYTEINFRNGFNEIVKYKSRRCLLPTAACHISDESIFIPASQRRRRLHFIHWWKDSFITTIVCTNCHWLNHKYRAPETREIIQFDVTQFPWSIGVINFPQKKWSTVDRQLMWLKAINAHASR